MVITIMYQHYLVWLAGGLNPTKKRILTSKLFKRVLSRISFSENNLKPDITVLKG